MGDAIEGLSICTALSGLVLLACFYPGAFPRLTSCAPLGQNRAVASDWLGQGGWCACKLRYAVPQFLFPGILWQGAADHEETHGDDEWAAEDWTP